MPSGCVEGLIVSSEAVQEGVSDEGRGSSVTANRYNDTAELVADGRLAHLFRSLSSTSIGDVRSSSSSCKIVAMMQTTEPRNERVILDL
jgi:hypothetical protein